MISAVMAAMVDSSWDARPWKASTLLAFDSGAPEPLGKAILPSEAGTGYGGKVEPATAGASAAASAGDEPPEAGAATAAASAGEPPVAGASAGTGEEPTDAGASAGAGKEPPDAGAAEPGAAGAPVATAGFAAGATLAEADWSAGPGVVMGTGVFSLHPHGTVVVM